VATSTSRSPTPKRGEIEESVVAEPLGRLESGTGVGATVSGGDGEL